MGRRDRHRLRHRGLGVLPRGDPDRHLHLRLEADEPAGTPAGRAAAPDHRAGRCVLDPLGQRLDERTAGIHPRLAGEPDQRRHQPGRVHPAPRTAVPAHDLRRLHGRRLPRLQRLRRRLAARQTGPLPPARLPGAVPGRRDRDAGPVHGRRRPRPHGVRGAAGEVRGHGDRVEDRTGPARVPLRPAPAGRHDRRRDKDPGSRLLPGGLQPGHGRRRAVGDARSDRPTIREANITHFAFDTMVGVGTVLLGLVSLVRPVPGCDDETSRGPGGSTGSRRSPA